MLRTTSLPLRRRLALLICPEVIGPMLAATVVAPRPVSDKTEHVIRLGHVLLAATGTVDFYAALGIERARPLGSVPGYMRPRDPLEAARRDVQNAQFAWRRIVKAPPQNIRAETYAEIVGWFSKNWPRQIDLAWPPQIPRPATSKEAA